MTDLYEEIFTNGSLTMVKVAKTNPVVLGFLLQGNMQHASKLHACLSKCHGMDKQDIWMPHTNRQTRRQTPSYTKIDAHLEKLTQLYTDMPTDKCAEESMLERKVQPVMGKRHTG